MKVIQFGSSLVKARMAIEESMKCFSRFPNCSEKEKIIKTTTDIDHKLKECQEEYGLLLDRYE